MFEGLGEDLFSGDSPFRAVLVEGSGGHAHRAVDEADVSGEGETSFFDFSIAFGPDDLGVYEPVRVFFGQVDGDDALQDADLVCGESDTVGIDEGFNHVGCEFPDVVVDAPNDAALAEEDGVGEFADFANGHGYG